MHTPTTPPALQLLGQFSLRARRLIGRYEVPHSACPADEAQLPAFIADLLHIDSATALCQETFAGHDTLILVDFIERSHSYYLDACLPQIEHDLHRLSTEAGLSSNSLLIISALWRRFTTDLSEHIAEEAQTMLPLAKQLSSGARIYSASRIDDRRLLESFLDDHEETTVYIDEILHLLDGIDDGRTSIQVLRQRTAGLKDDILIHEYIEEQVLLPRLLAACS